MSDRLDTVPMHTQNDAKKKDLEAIIKSIEESSQTCRLSLHFKDGRLVAGDKFMPVLK